MGRGVELLKTKAPDSSLSCSHGWIKEQTILWTCWLHWKMLVVKVCGKWTKIEYLLKFRANELGSNYLKQGIVFNNI